MKEQHLTCLFLSGLHCGSKCVELNVEFNIVGWDDMNNGISPSVQIIGNSIFVPFLFKYSESYTTALVSRWVRNVFSNMVCERHLL